MAKRSERDARIRRAAERAMDAIDDMMANYPLVWSRELRSHYERSIRALQSILREVS